jgi:predicted  nucleic acid-binding Zn-ribbon protein
MKQLGSLNLASFSRLDQELAKGGKVQALQDKVNELDREVTKLKAQLEMDEGNLTDEQKRAAATQKNVQEVGSLR